MKKRWTALLLVLVLLLGTVTALAESWYCPECGQKNDGNFCSNCGTKKPSGDLAPGNTSLDSLFNNITPSSSSGGMKVEKVVMNTDGSFSITWSGGKAPYDLDYTWYVNDSHNSGVDVVLWSAAENYYSTSITLKEDLVPGEHYWLRLTDSENNVLWYDYKSERRAFTQFSGTRMTLSLRTRKNNRSSTVNSFTANDIERGYLSSLYGATIKMTIGSHVTDYLFTARMAIFLPNGEPILFYVDDVGISRRASWAYWDTMDFKNAWDTIMRVKGTIPAGRYTFRLYADDRLFGEEVVNIY